MRHIVYATLCIFFLISEEDIKDLNQYVNSPETSVSHHILLNFYGGILAQLCFLLAEEEENGFAEPEDNEEFKDSNDDFVNELNYGKQLNILITCFCIQ